MRLSQSFIKTTRSIDANLESKNARLLIQAGYIRQELAGVYTFLNFGLRVLNNIESIVREEMDSVGIEILMPTLSSKKNWETTNRIETVDILFKASGANTASLQKQSIEYIVNSTHEEIITPLVQNYVKSYKDFPIAVYQIQTKFRNEARAKSGLLRCREFRMKDLYSFHTSEEDLLSFYEGIKPHYMNIFNRLGIGKDTYITCASGGDFTTAYSHEFQTLLDTGEDTIYLDKEKGIAYNKEIVTEKDALKLGVDFSKFDIVKASEVGNIFPLNTKFSNAFSFNYVDKENKKHPVFMGCYGIGTSRLVGVIAEKYSDDKGLVWPKQIAPFLFQLISLSGIHVMQESESVYNTIKNDCLWDDRDIGAGEKFKDADLIGCPYQLIMSEKTIALHSIEVKSRSGQFAPFMLNLDNIQDIHTFIENHCEQESNIHNSLK